MFKDLLFYDGRSGATEFYATRNGGVSLLPTGFTLGPGYTHVVHGFDGGLLCYDAGSGTIRIHGISITWGSHLLLEMVNWRKGWTHIVAGSRFAGPYTNDFLFYDAATGTGEFYTLSARRLNLVSRYTNWRRSWRHIVSGSFATEGSSDLLFYDAAAGVGEFYAVKEGRISRMRSYDRWRTSWTLIAPVDFTFINSYTALLFYDAAARTGEFYSGSQGRMTALRTHTGWRSTWRHIVAGHFGGETDVVLLFYDPAAGAGEFYRFDNGRLQLLRSHTGWRSSWTHIVPGYYAHKPQPF